MSDLPAESPPIAPPRHVPPSGWRVAIVLIAIITGITVLCAGCVIGYMFYVDARQR